MKSRCRIKNITCFDSIRKVSLNGTDMILNEPVEFSDYYVYSMPNGNSVINNSAFSNKNLSPAMLKSLNQGEQL